jgi:hypothetical protein
MILAGIRRFDNWIRQKPERAIPLGIVVGVPIILVGLVVHPYVLAFGILWIVFVTPGVYLRHRLLNWIESRVAKTKRPSP